MSTVLLKNCAFFLALKGDLCMAKPITGKTHVGERREKRPNGDIYVYERITAYNQKTRKTYTVSQKFKGKIKSGTQKYVPLVRKNARVKEGVLMQHVGIPALRTSWNGLAKFPALIMMYVLHSARVIRRRCFLSHAIGSVPVATLCRVLSAGR